MTNEPEVLAEDTERRGAERGRREPKLLGVGGDRHDELTGRSTTWNIVGAGKWGASLVLHE